MFVDRQAAGRTLAGLLGAYADAPATAVLGIPRGGVVVAAEVARELRLPLGVVVTAKIAAPDNPEYALGALAPDGVVTADPRLGYTDATLQSFAGPAHSKVEHALAEFASPPAESLSTAIVVDDGLATGLTALAAVRYLRRLGILHVVLAVPVAAEDSAHRLRAEVDELVVADIPPFFAAVGQFYRSFPQTQDSQVRALLAEARRSTPSG